MPHAATVAPHLIHAAVTRPALRRHVGRRVTVTATYDRRDRLGRGAVLLKQVEVNGVVVADHVWCDAGWFADIDPGAQVRFEGVVAVYQRRYGARVDLGISVRSTPEVSR